MGFEFNELHTILYSLIAIQFVSPIKQSMEEKGKGVKRYFIETAPPELVIVDEPDFAVAVGGVPASLIINSAHVISFTLSFPISKVPKNLPLDPAERRRVFFKALKEVRSQIESRKTCWICKQEAYCTVYIYVIPPFPSDFNDALAPASIPSQSMEESEEDDSPYWYLLNGTIVIRQPRFVGVVGGIQQDMKIKDGISFWVPSPKFKYPKVMPADYIERRDAIIECYTKGLKSDAFVNAILQAYIKAKSEAHGLRLASSSSICHNIGQQPPTIPMMEISMAATPGSTHLPYNDRSQAVKYLTLVESPTGCTFLRRNFSESREFVPLVGVIINEPGIVAAVGGIPNELKIEGAKTFWFRCPALKYSHIEAEDYEDDVDDVDANGDDVDDMDAYEDGVDDMDANEDGVDDVDDVYDNGDNMDAKEVEYIKIFREDVVRAYREVCRVSSSSSLTCKQEAEAHSIDPLCPMAEVNILESQFGSAFDELNKDNNAET